MMADTTIQTPLQDCRNAWAATIEALAADNPRIVTVVNDSVGSSKLNGFQKKYPDRLINVGIAEQVMVGVSAGLANGGLIPFVSAASCFLTGRALEQIKADIAYAGFNVKLVGQSSGVAYGELGATHHSIEDLTWLRALGAITLIAPADAWETAQAVTWAAAHDGPVYLRLSRMPVPDLQITDRVFRPGTAEMLRDGDDLTIIACGTTVHLAVTAADALRREGISARVLNMATLNPIDQMALRDACATGAIVTVEEALITGGLGGAVAEYAAAHHPVPVERVGFPAFLPTGSVQWLFTRYGLSTKGIIAAAQKTLQRKG
ncbi:transketolase family protein [Roseinatronobacter alkalisoli]|uniref:Transketolase C-terminal domain-containing protein n=1 Tax=Roseinatronobacter alkalisoli TaxID=3028235 RepID=A0ABT5TFL6_9RHOB|nr:transketolase C-terminal domain-containing protein [Roseinatronobacter sp. HJB301]MDD7973917.1 transketolase C-terminal domain-containing protein [Roseinatronobacter sp. HJB301]